MKDNVRDALSKHFFHLAKIGLYYAYLSQQAYINGLNEIGDYIRYLSDDKLGVHKDKIADYLTEISVSLNHSVKTLDDIDYATFDPNGNRFENGKKIISIVKDLEVNDEKRVNETASLIWEAGDHATYAFFSWYTIDALKDLNEVKDILDDFSMSSDLLTIDRRVKRINKKNRREKEIAQIEAYRERREIK